MRKRIFSLFMAFAMMLSLVPGTAMAAPADAETKRLYLPVVPEGEQMPEAEEESSLFELTEGEEDTIYIAEGTEEVSLRDICFTSAEEPAANGILYIVDEEGRVLAAGDDTVSYYEETSNEGEYCIGYVWFSE